MMFGDRLKEARHLKGLTQEQLAEKIGVAKSTLTGYEKGNREPDVAKIKALARELDITADDLLGIKLSPYNDPTIIQPDERPLIEAYRPLSAEGKAASLAYVEGRRDAEAAQTKTAPAEAEAELEVYPGEPMSKHRDLSAITIQRTVAADQGGGMIVTMTPEQQKAFLAEARRLEEEDRKKAEEERSGLT